MDRHASLRAHGARRHALRDQLDARRRGEGGPARLSHAHLRRERLGRGPLGGVRRRRRRALAGAARRARAGTRHARRWRTAMHELDAHAARDQAPDNSLNLKRRSPRRPHTPRPSLLWVLFCPRHISAPCRPPPHPSPPASLQAAPQTLACATARSRTCRRTATSTWFKRITGRTVWRGGTPRAVATASHLSVAQQVS